MPASRIILMGTPGFAVPSLEILIQNKFNVVAVVTAPDKPQGRGQKLTPSSVKECALGHNIPVLQPVTLKLHAFIEELKSYQANLQVVVAFRMLPEVIWSMPELGTFNLHASLLPQYRGAAPINWAIINGEKETGITTFFLRQEIDTGSIIFQEKEPIHENDDAGSLYDRLITKGADLVLKTVKAIEDGHPPTIPQPQVTHLKQAPKIFKATREINWSQPSEHVRNFVRGLSPYPAAWSSLNGKIFKIFTIQIPNANEPTFNNQSSNPWETDNKTYLYFRTSDGWVSIEELQPEGKRRMTIRDFFRGNRV